METFRISRNAGREDFDRHLAAKPCVSCSIHLAHTARADEREDFISAETSAGR